MATDIHTLLNLPGGVNPLALVLAAVLFGILIAVITLWVVLPFAVFGIKALLRDIRAQQRETCRSLEELRQRLDQLVDQGRKTSGPGTRNRDWPP